MTITAAKRASLTSKQFGLPSKDKYPIDTVARAKNAKARSAQQVGKSITPAEKEQIDRRANVVIRKAGGNPAPPSGKPKTGSGSGPKKSRRDAGKGGMAAEMKRSKARLDKLFG